MLEMIKYHENKLINHPVYQELNDIESLRIFMGYHIFAVWDFMSLLKSLQNKITCTNVPWMPSPFSDKLVRFINEIVVAEESDLDEEGLPLGHYRLYEKAMDEVKADMSCIKDFHQSFDLSGLPQGIRQFVSFNLDIALNGKLEEVAGSFLFGREKLLPEVFQSIINALEKTDLKCPKLIYYFKRHIEVDGDDHGPMAQEALEEICGNDESKWLMAYNAGVQSLQKRELLWDSAMESIKKKKVKRTNSDEIYH